MLARRMDRMKIHDTIMLKMLGYTTMVLLSVSVWSSCVKDESTTGDSYTANDDTYAPAAVRAVMNEQQQRVIDYFYRGAEATTGMACNSSSDPSVLTTGATGFGVMNLIIGAERGWISRDDAAARIVKIVRFLKTADRFAGAWAHWYKPTGRITPFGDQVQAGELVETAFMMGGLLTACEYFTGDSDDEKEIRETTRYFWETIEWNRFADGNRLYWIWHANEDRLELPLAGWNETLLVYILALAAPAEHRVSQEIYRSCWQNAGFFHPDRKTYGYPLPLGDDTGGPLFLSQYSFLGLDPRLLEDAYCYYWTQNQSHTLVNRHYCVYKAPAAYRYSAADWGLTACAGCGSNTAYLARDPENDDGIIAPTAAISAFPYTPFYSAQVLLNLKINYPELNGKYGFGTSYCPADRSVGSGYLAMEHAPMAIMMENYRSGLIWKLLMQNEHIQEGLRLAGIKAVPAYTPGFYLAQADTETGVCDLIRHPDRERYEIDFYTRSPGKGVLTLTNVRGEEVYRTETELQAGPQTVAFFDSSVVRGRKYRLALTDAGGQVYALTVALR